MSRAWWGSGGAGGGAEVDTPWFPCFLFLLLPLILFGAGFVVKILWWVAIAVLVLWLVGFVARPKGGSGRWYRW